MERIDLGLGCVAEVHDEYACLIWRHTRPDNGAACNGGAIPWRGPDCWTSVSREPLTLSPSLLCRACGRHGWIRGGAWVPA